MKLKIIVAFVLLLVTGASAQWLSVVGSKSPIASNPATYTIGSRLCSGTVNTCTGTQTSGLFYVVVSLSYNATSTTCSISDGTNTFTNTPSSPVVDGAALHRAVCFGYHLAAASGSITYAATWTGSGHTDYGIQVFEFTFTSGPPSLDTGATGSGSAAGDAFFVTSSTATPLVLPTITPSTSGRLLVSAEFTDNGACTGTGGSWTAGISTVNGNCATYILSSASGATTVNFTDGNNPDGWVGVEAAFQ